MDQYRVVMNSLDRPTTEGRHWGLLIGGDRGCRSGPRHQKETSDWPMWEGGDQSRKEDTKYECKQMEHTNHKDTPCR